MEQLFWTVAEFSAKLGMNERKVAKVLATVPSRKRGARTEYDVAHGMSALFAERHGYDPASICPTCLMPRAWLPPGQTDDEAPTAT